ncbi:MAG TPA: DNA-processing protein DprA [Casimicrobiaceae bacterium]|nr:DNA-processing protein DprA [Casimicrobiaceae bacterium]
MKVDARALAWVRLQVSGVGPRPQADLLRAFGSPEAVIAATPAQRRKVVGAAASPLDAGPDASRLDAALAWLGDDAHGIVALDDADYPGSLLEIADPPPTLYWMGRRELLGRPALAIVGSRNATPQGMADARAFAHALADAGLTIVSGLALGIDAAAHRGALEGEASSIAVTGTGLDRVYPAQNRALAHDLAQRGLVVSEFAPGTPPLPQNFPRRNRIVSGLARGVLVIEATASSGSLITARFAAEQGREVFAVPGSIHSPFSKGCHRLLREGAKLVETAEDVLSELRLPARAAPRAAIAATNDDELTADERAVIAALGHAPSSVDALVARSGLAAEAVAAALVALELAGRASPLPGGLWQPRA